MADADPLSPLAGFLQHGLLPFVGREGELARLQNFWNDLDDATALSSAVVAGEQGVGKSRLVETFAASISSPFECIVRVRLQQDGTASLAATLAHALASESTVPEQLRPPHDTPLRNLIARLRKLCRLRKTLLILEDLHWTSEETLAEFATLVSALCDEPLGVLCITRFVPLALRGMLEPSLSCEVTVDGLPRERIGELLSTLFPAVNLESEVAQQLADASAGNPSMLRTILRACISRTRSPQIVHLEYSQLRRAIVETQQLAFERITAGLDTEERRWAGQLATLGMGFTVETARVVLDEPERALRTLRVKGVILDTPMLVPLAGGLEQSKAAPLMFSSRLLQRTCLRDAPVDVDRLWHTILTRQSIYSIEPIRLILEHVDALSCSVPEILEGLERMMGNVSALNNTNVAAEGEMRTMVEMCEAVAAHYAPALTDNEKLASQLPLHYMRVDLFIYMGEGESEERTQRYQQLLTPYVALVEGPLPDHLLWHRISALGWQFNFETRRSQQISYERLHQIEELVESHRELLTGRPYLNFLGWVLQYVYDQMFVAHGLASGVDELHDLVRRRCAEIASSDNDNARQWLHKRISPLLINLYRTVEEREEAADLYAATLRTDRHGNRTSWSYCLTYLLQAGDMEEALRLALEGSEERNVHAGRYRDTTLPWILTAVNTPLEETHERSLAMAQAHPPGTRSQIGGALYTSGLLRGEAEWVDRIVPSYLAEGEGPPPFFILLLMRRHLLGELEARLGELQKSLRNALDNEPARYLERSPYTNGALRRLARHAVLHEEEESTRSLEEDLCTFLCNPLTDFRHYRDLVPALILLELCERTGRANLLHRLGSAIHTALLTNLAWLVETRRIIYASTLLADYSRFLSRDEAHLWRQRIDAGLTAQRERLYPDAQISPQQIRISMIGRIGYGGEKGLVPIKGARLKQMLGLMTLNSILETPLDRGAFHAELMDGSEREMKGSDVVKMAVYSLRKTLGNDAIVYDGGVPHLNPVTTQVDLLDAWHALLDAEEELSRGLLKNAAGHLDALFDIVANETPFPALYGSIFESARDDFEARSRRIIIRTATALVEEGDGERCEKLLHRAVKLYAGDQTLIELLEATLEGNGKRCQLDLLRKAALRDDTDAFPLPVSTH